MVRREQPSDRGLQKGMLIVQGLWVSSADSLHPKGTILTPQTISLGKSGTAGERNPSKEGDLC